MWTLKDNVLLLLQEIQEHTKAVPNLTISESGDRLYSGSLDRTAKVKNDSSNLNIRKPANNGFVLLKNRSGLLERKQYIVSRCKI